MFQTGFLFNTAYAVCIYYFLIYCLSIFGLCLIFVKYLHQTSLISELGLYNQYSKKSSLLLLFLLLTFLGVPPCGLFIPKFAGLAVVWVTSGWLVFLSVFIVTLLSFGLYAQLFDLLFAKKTQHLLKNNSKMYKINKKLANAPKSKQILSIYILGITGVFFFKDFMFVFSVLL